MGIGGSTDFPLRGCREEAGLDELLISGGGGENWESSSSSDGKRDSGDTSRVGAEELGFRTVEPELGFHDEELGLGAGEAWTGRGDGVGLGARELDGLET